MTKKTDRDEMMKRLGSIAVKGNAGMEPLKRSITRKERAEKAQGRSVEGKARSTSFSITPADDAILTHLSAEMAGEGIRVRDSHLMRAGLIALDELPVGDLVELVNRARAADGRRKG